MLQERLREDETDIDAVVSLALLETGEDRIDEARALLVDAAAYAPSDPAIPLLLAYVEERSGSFADARDLYASYARTESGLLGRLARVHLDGIESAALREDAAVRLAATAGASGPGRAQSVAVLPFAHAPNDPRADGLSATVNESMIEQLRLGPADVVRSAEVRALVDVMGVASDRLGDLDVGVRAASALNAETVVQVIRTAPTPDSIQWDATVTTLGDGGSLSTTHLPLRGDVLAVPEMVTRLVDLVRLTLEGSLPTHGAGTEARIAGADRAEALVAYGAGLRAWDRGDHQAAVRAFATALDLDPGLRRAESFLARAEAVVRLEASGGQVELVRIAQVAQLRRTVMALRDDPWGGHQDALSTVGLRERALLADVLGLDRLAPGRPVDLRFVLPGGGRP